MGTHFTAVLNHNLSAHDIHTVPDLLNSNWNAVEQLLPIIEGYPFPGFPLNKWQWREASGFSLERLRDRVTIGIESHEFSGNVSQRLLRLFHIVRWESFLSEQTVRDKLRGICRHIASILGTNQVIYIPSGFLRPEGAIGQMYDGKAVEEMIDWLLENCGPPVQDIQSIYREDVNGWNENVYYIERV